tara:strand:+ start:5109 stop:5585 length:477 start_codon:yes stop_codon:yes gene_type:complete
MIKNNILSIFFVIGIFLLDRISKILVVNYFNKLETSNISVFTFLDLSLVWNDGIAFGLFAFEHNFYYNLLTIIIVTITLFIFWMITKYDGLDKISFTMIFGGSIGNIFDRILHSSVPDFIDIHINNFHWFIFNVADIFITLGVVLLIYSELFLKKNKI